MSMKKPYCVPTSIAVSLSPATFLFSSTENEYSDNQGKIRLDFESVSADDAD